MRNVTYSMGVSLDGYIVGPDGSFDWQVRRDPDPILHHRQNRPTRRSHATCPFTRPLTPPRS